MPELLWNRAPATPVATLVLAHGAGAPMDSPFMATMAGLLAERGIEVARFEFAYMARRREEGIKAPPDRAPRLMACFQAVLDEVRRTAPGPVWVGGKSMGGRMATMLAADPDTAPDGCVVFGYPFHPPRQTGKDAAGSFPGAGGAGADLPGGEGPIRKAPGSGRLQPAVPGNLALGARRRSRSHAAQTQRHRPAGEPGRRRRPGR